MVHVKNGRRLRRDDAAQKPLPLKQRPAAQVAPVEPQEIEREVMFRLDSAAERVDIVAYLKKVATK